MRFRCALLFTASLLLAVPMFAEVGVILRGDRFDSDGDPIGLPYLQSIIDVPDPISAWQRHSSPDDSDRKVLNPDGGTNGDGAPAVIYDSNRQTTLVFWSRNTTGGVGYKVVYAEFIDGSWTSPRRINQSDGQQYDPQAAIGADGTTYIVYWQIQGAEHSVWMQTIGNGPDRSWGAPVSVSQAGIASCRPSVAVHNGAPLIAYEVHPNGAGSLPKDVVVASFENDAFLEEVVATSSHTEPLWPQIHSRGDKVWVDWVDFTQAPFEGDMAWLKKTNTGWTSISYETFSSQADLEYDVRETIASEASGAQGGGQAQQVPPNETP